MPGELAVGRDEIRGVGAQRPLPVFRHEAPAHVRCPCIVVDEAEGMNPIESRIGVARRRIVGLQEMKLRGLVGMLFHEGSELAGIGFACV
jgi:hypothetical protein